jgi:hypothetical protein
MFATNNEISTTSKETTYQNGDGLSSHASNEQLAKPMEGIQSNHQQANGLERQKTTINYSSVGTSKYV